MIWVVDLDWSEVIVDTEEEIVLVFIVVVR